MTAQPKRERLSFLDRFLAHQPRRDRQLNSANRWDRARRIEI